MPKVELLVHCKRGGVSRDGGVHAAYPDRETAELQAPQEIRWLKGFYDEVGWSLVDVMPAATEAQV